MLIVASYWDLLEINEIIICHVTSKYLHKTTHPIHSFNRLFILKFDTCFFKLEVLKTVYRLIFKWARFIYFDFVYLWIKKENTNVLIIIHLILWIKMFGLLLFKTKIIIYQEIHFAMIVFPVHIATNMTYGMESYLVSILWNFHI